MLIYNERMAGYEMIQNHREVWCDEAGCPGCGMMHRLKVGEPLFYRNRERITQHEFMEALRASMPEAVNA